MFTLNCRGKLLVLEKPLVMGIINVTPDSFFAGSRAQNAESILREAGVMLSEGADILDIGGQSTRPGSTGIDEREELSRVLPAVETISKNYPEAIISVDTFQSSVAKEAIAAGASIINDISGGSLDNNMLATIGALKIPYICMHMKGTPQTMQSEAVYADVTREVLDYFIQKAALCKEAGITDIIIDPGFGFAKTIAHNFELMKNLEIFKMLGMPILAGISRKSTIYKTLGIDVTESLNGTTVLNTLALLNGASILRVHDVREAKQVVTLLEKYKAAGSGAPGVL